MIWKRLPIRRAGARIVVIAAILVSPTVADAAESQILLPLGRTAYFVGEQILLAPVTEPAMETVTLQARGRDGAVHLYAGPPKALWLDTSRLAPGDYQLLLDGQPTGQRLTLTSPLRRSPGSLHDEALPSDDLPHEVRREVGGDTALYEQKLQQYHEGLVQTLRETGLTGSVAMAAVEMPQRKILDVLARTGVMVLANPDTRPTSFFPVGDASWELEGMSQRMLLIAQAIGR